MNTKTILFAGGSLLAGLSACKSTVQEQKTPMNVIYILVDDLGYGDLSCYGQQKFQTPNLDRMAAEGMLFTQHYAGCTVSAPSRASLMTGLHTGHTQVRGNREISPEGQEPMAEGTFTIGKLMQEA
ncbi:MAG: sulfatase-like hydrolase/transferase, partial [Petrimonas sp.]